MSKNLKLIFFSALAAFAVMFFHLIPLAAGTTNGAALTYRKVFKGSSPEFLEIRVSLSGCTYDIRPLSEAADPQPFEVSAELVQRMFSLAAQLHNFRDAHLDIRKRIANLGEKTFRYERGNETYETRFNYTTHPAANELMQLFEGLGRQQDHLQTLTHRMRFDRLGVNSALLNFEADFDRKIIPEPERLLPALEQLAADPRFVEIARQRARGLIGRIKAARAANVAPPSER
jgi:hypothetical protein